MVTPFLPSGHIDYPALRALTEFYIRSGAAGLFAVCQSRCCHTHTHSVDLALVLALLPPPPPTQPTSPDRSPPWNLFNPPLTPKAKCTACARTSGWLWRDVWWRRRLAVCLWLRAAPSKATSPTRLPMSSACPRSSLPWWFVWPDFPSAAPYHPADTAHSHLQPPLSLSQGAGVQIGAGGRGG